MNLIEKEFTKKEFEEQKTPESRIARALDKIEALIQHNESDLSTWEPHEYSLNLGYAEEEVKVHEATKELLEVVRIEMRKKIAKGRPDYPLKP